MHVSISIPKFLQPIPNRQNNTIIEKMAKKQKKKRQQIDSDKEKVAQRSFSGHFKLYMYNMYLDDR